MTLAQDNGARAAAQSNLNSSAVPPTGLLVRLGIGAQLSIGFIAVALLALVANLLLQRDQTAIRTRVERIAPVAPASVAAPVLVPASSEIPAPAPGASIAVLEKPAAPRRARVLRSMTTAPKPDALLTALNELQRSVQSVATLGSAAPRDAVVAADAAVLETLDQFTYGSARVGAANDALKDVRNLVRMHQVRAQEISKTSSRRAELAADYSGRLDALEILLKAPLEQSVRVFGRLFARDSIIAVNQAIDAVRQHFDELESARGLDGGAVERMARAEAAFSDALQAQQRGLERSLGATWVTQKRTAFVELVGLRETLTRYDAKQADALVRFAADTAGVSSAVTLFAGRLAKQRAAAVAAARAGAEASRTPTPVIAVEPPAPAVAPAPALPLERTVTERITTESASSISLLGITSAVLLLLLMTGMATVRSVTVPVRRLMDATRRLARGERNVSVPRGGSRELDALGVAFNGMARQLVTTRAELEQQRQLLEAQVVERTRELRHLAENDPLTELPNRRYLFTHLTAAITRAESAMTGVGVFFLDVDNFKTINDSLSHEFGDQVLQEVSLRLRQVVGVDGFCARLGGDEFTVVHEGLMSDSSIRALSSALIRAFGPPLHVGGQDVKVTVSVGVSLYPEHAREAEGLLRAADTALFRSKERGRNQYAVFNQEMLEDAARRFTIEQGLHGAIERDEFRLVFQPEVQLDGLRPCSVEALLRWQQPDGRLVAPGEFLPVAEQSKLILDIGDWVMRSAIRKAAEWHRGPWPDACIAVNVSPRQLLDGRFVGRVAELLRHYDLPPRCLEIELTESVLQTGLSTVDSLRDLRALGISIALDDFGTGYSSLASLEKLPLSRVKLDRSLISEIDTSERALAITHAIIELCGGLGLEVTAEGVERPTQLALLARERHVTIQGYLLSRPVPEAEWLALLPRLPGLMEQHILSMPAIARPARAAQQSDARKFLSLRSGQ